MFILPSYLESFGLQSSFSTLSLAAMWIISLISYCR